MVERADVSAGLLGIVKRRVGVSNQVDDIGCVFRVISNSHAGCHEDLVALHEERIGQSVEDLLREFARRFLSLSLGAEFIDDDSKFVAGKPTDDRIHRDRRRQALRDSFQRRISCKMTKRVIDILEVIDIDVEQTQRFVGASCPSDAALQQVLEFHPIRDLGERIDASEVTNASLGPLALGNVLGGVDAIPGAVPTAADDRAGIGNGDGFSVLAF